MLALLLCTVLTVLFVALFYAGEYEVSPVGIAKDNIRTRLTGYFYRNGRERLYRLTGRNPNQIIKTGVLVGTAVGLLVVILTAKPLTVLLIPVFILAGILFFDSWIGMEYNQWRESLLDGVPTLVHFFPSFLETGAITPRRALELTVPFLSEPLRSEMDKAVHQLYRTGYMDALSELAEKANDSIMKAICFRLQALWDTGVKPDIFADLDDQIRNMEEIAASRATAAKSGLIALLCVIGLIGAGLEFGYPAWKYFLQTMSGMFM